MRSLRSIVAAIMVALMSSFVAAPAHATIQTDFIAKLVGPAQENQRNTGIPASVAIGMAALESGWGRSTMASTMLINGVTYEVNTLFNIKCTSVVSPYQTGCVPVPSYEYRSDGTKYLLTSNFRTYANWGNSLLDYGRLLTTASRYSEAFKYSAYPDQFIIEVHKAGYATDPKYSELVTSIMKSYNLYQYNTNGAGSGLPSETPSMETLRRGAQGVAVVDLQARLNAWGAALVADGNYGAQTQHVVTQFQQFYGLTPTGAMDASTWALLQVAPTPRVRPVQRSVSEVTYPALASGATGARVTALQHLLNAKGAAVAVDGRYGSGTIAAVKALQSKSGLAATGEMSKPTWDALLPTLSYNATGSGVRALQVLLAASGYEIPTTGNFVDQTLASVRDLEIRHHIVVNGVVDHEVWAVLFG
ncbi:MAG TPA: peptidoglycan-binding protein [Tessaracoccus flavescens]|uniref:Peptidoglycan-binding protein n=1 Tax=Tessaracoccus flavescens TaxID=399497 RepID=A0A921EN42_9ACTN|nr:peptidoglycan-binding protein [Tessaracoccus flavescens]